MPPRKTVLSSSLGSFGMSRTAQINLLNNMFAPKIQRFFKTQFVLPTQWIKLFHVLDSQNKGWTFNVEAMKDDIVYQIQFQHRTMNQMWTIDFKVYYGDESKSRREKLSFRGAKESLHFYKLVFFILVRLPKCVTCMKGSSTKFMIVDFIVGKTSVVSLQKGWKDSTLHYILDKLEIVLPLKSPLSKDFLVEEETFLVRFLNSSSYEKKHILNPSSRPSQR